MWIKWVEEEEHGVDEGMSCKTAMMYDVFKRFFEIVYG
jgi:hypothetical protein